MSIAAFIREEDRVPLQLAFSLYQQPLNELGTYKLIPGSFKIRYGAWIDETTGICIVGCRGTQFNTKNDLLDDEVSLLEVAKLFTNFQVH